MDATGARTVLRDLFCRPGALYGGFDENSARYREGHLGPTHEFALSPDLKSEEGRRHKLLVHRVLLYPGISGVAAALWEQMARTLLRLRIRPSRALPRIIAAGYSDTHLTAFVNTESAADSLASTGVVERVTEPTLASRQALLRAFVDLVHALSTLHGQGILHRNVCPESIEYLRPAGGEDFKLRLARFEMSALLGDAFEPSDPDQQEASELRRRRFLAQDPRALLCASPERLASAFRATGHDRLETDRSDVFSLGVIAWSWWMPPLTATKVTEFFASDNYDASAHRSIHGDMIAALTAARATRPDGGPDPRRTPAKLAELISRMLAWNPADRISSHELATQLSLHLDALLAPWDETSTRTYFLGTMPDKARNTVWAWGRMRHEPTTEAGRQELVELIERDLRRAHVAYSPKGYSPWEGSDDQKFQETKYVLVGNEYAWFCNQYRDHGVSPATRVDELLLIRYVLELSRHRRQIEALAAASYIRLLPAVTVVPIDVRETDPTLFREVGQSWGEYLRSVRARVESPGADAFGRALQLLLDWQAAELTVRTFPFTRLVTESGRYARLQVDETRRQAQIYQNRSPLPTLLLSQQPIGMRPLFEGLTEGRTVSLAVYSVDDPDEKLGDVTLGHEEGAQASSDENIITVEIPPGLRVPSRGWIRPADDFGSDVQGGRLWRALEELRETPELRDQLASPRVIVDLTSRWAGAGADLQGGADAVVRRMLGTEPFFAVQGPPGTGKTTVVARAVTAYLDRRRAARVLVSAQSNYALDNLAERIMARFTREERPIAYRVTPARGVDERVSPPMREYDLEKVTSRVVAQIEAACKRRLSADDYGDYGRWRELHLQILREVASHRIEIRERIRRAASLVFATCLSATAENVSTHDEFNLFDWVIVEEAAKCWLTEMAVPLLRGVRWTLVGDHKQLPAFRRDDVDRLLDACADSGERQLRALGDRNERRAFEATYDFFQHLFDTPPTEKGATAALTLQFRMPELIGDIVGRTFYPSAKDASASFLATADAKKNVPPPWREPDWLRERHPLVWVDTTDAELEDLPYWSNPGEAELVARIVASIRPRPRAPELEAPTDTPLPLAVLTPYLRQAEVLRSRLVVHDAAWAVQTIDAFQGREAELVIVSLVRSTRRGSTPHASIGYLVREQRVNVLLSRARKTLVIVGNFELFRTCGVDFWESLCKQMAAHGVVARARSLGLTGGGSS